MRKTRMCQRHGSEPHCTGSGPRILAFSVRCMLPVQVNDVVPKRTALLSSACRVYAIDIIGEPGKSRQSQLLKNRGDCADWLCDLMQGLGLERTNIAGLSYGGWHTLNFSLFFPDRINKIIALAPGASIQRSAGRCSQSLRLLPICPSQPNPLKRYFHKGDCPTRIVFARQFAVVQNISYANPEDHIHHVISDADLGISKFSTFFIVGKGEVNMIHRCIEKDNRADSGRRDQTGSGSRPQSEGTPANR